MKNIIYLSLAALTLGFCGCSNETFEGESQVTMGQIKAVLPSTGSRTIMNGNSVLWSATDHIGIIAQNSEQFSNNDYQLTAGAGTQSGTFSGSFTGTLKLLAYYPYIASATCSDGATIKFSLPDSYTYNSGEPENNNNAPMACKIGADKQDIISFRNAGALIDITIKNIPAGYNKAVLTSTGTDAPNIAGEAQIAFDDSDNPALTTTGAQESKSVTISFTAATGATQDLRFYFPVPVTTYPELKISLTKDGSDQKDIKTFKGNDGKGVTATRGTRLHATVTIDKVTGVVPTEVASTTEANKALKESNAVTINEIKADETTPTVELPKRDESGANTPVNIAIENITGESKTVTLKESESGSGAADKEVNLSLGKVASNTTVDVTLANSTVTISSIDGTPVEIKQMTAATAANTLIIDKGVTIKELIVAKGNVKVYGVVEKISRKNENADNLTTVTSYGSADIREVTDENPSKFSFKSEWDGVSQVTPTDNKIYTAAQLASYQSKQVNQKGKVSALAVTMPNGATLFADIDLKDYDWQGIVLAANQTFDGNKKTISNLSMTKPVLDETGVATHPACIGLFAAAQSQSIIKDITLKGVKVGTESDNVGCKWVGSLVGYSQAVTFSNCKAENVHLYCNTNLGYNSSYRIGGLIGFIASSDAVSLTGCEVNGATIIANFSYGGLVGSVMTATTTFSGCKTSDINLLLGDCHIEDLGTVSKFIGDVELDGGTRSITINNGSSSNALTTAEKDALHFYMITKKDNDGNILTYTDGNQYVGKIIQTTLTLKVNGGTLTNGSDYNKYEKAPYTPGGMPQYDVTGGTTDWD